MSDRKRILELQRAPDGDHAAYVELCLRDALDVALQFSAYAEDMRAIGRGFCPTDVLGGPVSAHSGFTARLRRAIELVSPPRPTV